jgi:hypothetical protein
MYMDTQKMSQLDPKLRDAYERVMGIAIPKPQTTPSQIKTPSPASGSTAPVSATIQSPQPQSQPESNAASSTSEPQSTPLAPQSQSIPEQQASNFVRMNSEAPTSTSNSATLSPQIQTISLKKKNGILTPILFGIVALVFLVIYTLFWTKIFNFKLPFLP